MIAFKKFKELYEKNQKIIVPAFRRARLEDEADKIESCGKFVCVTRCLNCGTREFKYFYRCKSKFCLLCAKARAQLWVARLYEFLVNWLADGGYVQFINYSIRDRENLCEGVTLIQKAWRIMTGKSNQHSKEFKKRFVGGFKSLEVKIGKNSGMWHPHLHTLVLKKEKTKDNEFLTKLWRHSLEVAGGKDEGIVWFERFRFDNSSERSYNEQLLKAVVEVAKYMCKFDFKNDTVEHLQEMYGTLKGNRFRQFSTWGLLYNLKMQVEKDLDTMDNDEIEEFCCSVCGSNLGEFELVPPKIWSNEVMTDKKPSFAVTVDEEKVKRLQDMYDIQPVIEKTVSEQFEFCDIHKREFDK